MENHFDFPHPLLRYAFFFPGTIPTCGRRRSQMDPGIVPEEKGEGTAANGKPN